MAAYRVGDKEAGAQLLEMYYPELKRMAAHQLRNEREGHSWQHAVLVNELYLQLVKVKALEPVASQRQDDRAAFFALAGLMMRRLLIHHARPLTEFGRDLLVPVTTLAMWAFSRREQVEAARLF